MGVGPRRDTRRRLSVSEAADALGITVDAIRSRVKRGTITHERVGERVYVLLDADQSWPGHDQGSGQGSGQAAPPTEDRTVELIATLREQLAAERRANEENRRIIAALTQRIPEIEPPREAPSEPRESPVTATEQPGRVGPQPPLESPEMPADEQQGRGPVRDAEGPQEPAQPRSWWRRMFGG